MTSPLLLGIRHHGPGSARAVQRALAAYRPEVVLVEGPPEADQLVQLAAAEGMRPPVALLAYPASGKPSDPAAQSPRTALFWPFAEFSPEWQAIRWATEHEVPVRFCDLPAAHKLAEPSTADNEANLETAPETAPAGDSDSDPEQTGADHPRIDPIGTLAAAAGYDDPERWWEDVVEHRMQEAMSGQDPVAAALAPFAAIAEAMTEVRADAPDPPEPEHQREQRREAYMRTVLRAAQREFSRVAVVCGAWHVPALAGSVPAAADARVLRGLPKVKPALTWVPWTHGRLAADHGYGAGVSSPGWYHHLFTTPDHPIPRWLVRAAGVLRDEDLPVSSAHVIEAVRLAEALSTLRARPLAGLAEVTEATRSVLCDGDELRLELVNRKLVVGERLGSVPDEVPAVPLARDVAAAQRRLRLAPAATESSVDLDLRKPTDLDRSRLLHRLRLLGVGWGQPVEPWRARRGRGTFWESWQLCWQPEFEVDLVEASRYGTTALTAATARAVEQAAGASGIGEVTALVEQCLLADLPNALPPVLRSLDEQVALDASVSHLMAALPALARSLRYGDVRGTDVSQLRAVTAGLVVRICVGLPGAVTGLDDGAARQMRDQLDAVHAALALLEEESLRERWLTTLTRLVDRPDLPGLLGGRLVRLLRDAGRLEDAQARRRMELALSAGTPPARAAAWVEGLLAGGGLLLVHDARLLSLVDGWIAGIPAGTFPEVLPLLRRTFGEFAEPERRAIGERVRSGGPATGPETDTALDPELASRVLPTVTMLLGRDARELIGHGVGEG